MKKYWYLIIFTFLFAFAVTANASPARLVDNGELLSDSEATQVEALLDQVFRQCGIDVVIVTTNSLEGKSPEAFADDFYDYGGYGEDGVLLMLCMTTRDWHISTSGKCIAAFTDAVWDDLEEEMLPCLGSGQYSLAFRIFAEHSEAAVQRLSSSGAMPPAQKPGTDYVPPATEKADTTFVKLVVCLFIGLVAALIVTGVMRGKLKSVRSQADARNYVTSRLQLTQCLDLFMYRNVTRREKPRDNNSGSSGSFRSSGGSHRSSSGRSHGGRGGKF